MDSKLEQWIRLIWNQKRTTTEQERKTSDQSVDVLLDFQASRSRGEEKSYEGPKDWNIIKANLDRYFFPEVQNLTPKQNNRMNQIEQLRVEILKTPGESRTYRIALKVLLETADYEYFLESVRNNSPESNKNEFKSMSKLVDARANPFQNEKPYIYYALRGCATTGRDLPLDVIKTCKRLDDVYPDTVLRRVVIMYGIYGPPSRKNTIIKSPLTEQRRLELLMRLRQCYDPIPTNPSIFVDESDCTIACKLETRPKISISTCKDPEEFRYVVQMLLQPRPL